MLLSSIIETFEAEFLTTYPNALPSQLNALETMKKCRTTLSPVMRVDEACEHQCFIPHSCGHRSCPHCQHGESEQWLQRQLKKQLLAEYFLLTFTLPSELRLLAWQHQRIIYDLMLTCSWETFKTFVANSSAVARDLMQSAWAVRALLCGGDDLPTLSERIPVPLAELLRRGSEEAAWCARAGARGLDDALVVAAREAFGPARFIPFNPTAAYCL